MKDILEKIGLGEFFAYICPGAILLSSLALWIMPNFNSPFWGQEFLMVIIFFILSYSLGLILAIFNHIGLARYLRMDGKKRRGWLSKIGKAVLRFFNPFLSPRFTPSIVEANLRIAEDLERLSGVIGASAYINPLDWLVIYRAVKADRIGEKCKSILAEADIFHRRFRFAMGVSLAVFLVALQSFVRLFLLGLGVFYEPIFIALDNALPAISYPILTVIALFGLWASFELRRFAVQMWDLERYLTASLTQG